MFQKKERITTDRFKEIIDLNRTFHADLLYARFGVNNLDYSRFSVVVPKKVEKLSIKRHFLKRKINAVLEELKGQFKKGDYLVFAKESIKGKSFEDVNNSVKDLSKRTKV